MARIAFLLLCHKDPDGIIAQAERLTATGDFVAIHFDRRAGQAAMARLQAALSANPRVTFAHRRLRCGWGEWSLVAATLQALSAAEAAFPDASHFMLISGDCMPIKTAEYMHDRLDAEEADYIECFDFFDSDWIRTGLKEERLIYRHLFNERGQKRLFYAALDLQRRLGLQRALPRGLHMRIGSQWWCLRRRTVEAVLAFIRARPDILRFFRTTWIPDETFFQTLVAHLVPGGQIRSRTQTFLMFTDYGMPVVFYNDQYDLLLAQDHFFARKISGQAQALKARLSDLYGRTGVSFEIGNEGRLLHGFLTSRGREGRRFAPRLWETGAVIGRDRTLLVVACKKWHVAKRLARAVHSLTGLPSYGYLFAEDEDPVPPLGGIGASFTARRRHPPSYLRLLFATLPGPRLLFCVDTADVALLDTLRADGCELRILEVVCDFTDDYLIGHARRVGLAGDATQAGMLDALLPTVRADVTHDSDRLRDAGFGRLWRLVQSAGPAENAVPLAEFLAIPADTARQLAATDHLFSD